MKTNLVPCLAFVFASNLAMAQPAEDPVVVKELQAYYEKGKAPPWAAAIKNLVADKPDQRTTAAKYLVALLEQAQIDELSGKAPWRATPFWGSSGENPARNLRQNIADELAKAPASPATLTVLRWYFDHEQVTRLQEVVLPALDKVDGKEAGEFCVRLLQPAHENSVVVLAALQQVGKRKSELPDAVLKELCDQYRPSVRIAARKLNKERGGGEPGPFDPAKAVQRPALAALMTTIGSLLDQPAPPDAEFVKVTTKWTAGKDSETSTALGWLVKNDGDSWVVLTPFGHRETFHKEKSIKTRRGGESVVKSSWEKYPIADEVKRVVALRQKGDPDFALSERGGLTGQFQGRGAGVYEVILAHWLYTAKQFDLSAQVFLPALDSLYMDRHLVDMVRHRVGEAAGYRMLVAFAGDRDIAETQRLANALVQRYPGTRFHEYGVKLAKEMPKRQGDFKKLKLPTPEEWAALKKRLNRAEQIAYLAERMRLLNCFQMGQPGGYSIREAQYAEPCGLSRNAAWGLGNGQTKVINPYVELVGGQEGFFEDDDKKPFKGLDLTVADIPHLAPFLREDWHILCVSFWRDFSPDRHLDTTRPLFGSIIDGLAKRNLCQTDAMAKMTDAEKDKHIEAIIRWGKANANKSEPDLLWEALDDEVKAGAYFSELPNLARLIELKDKRLGPVLLQYLNEFDKKGARPNPNEFKIQGLDTSASSYYLHGLLGACLRYDASTFKEPARKFAKHKNVDIRLLAGHILFAGGDIPEGRKVFADILENGSPWQLEENALPELVRTLLDEGSPESKQATRLIFKNKRYTEIREGRVRASLVKQCAEAGIGDGYLSYLPLLDIKGPSIGNISYANGTVVGEIIAAEIIDVLAPKDPEIIRIKKTFPKAGDQIAPLKEWLRAKAKAADGEDQKGSALSDADKKYLDGLAREFLFDPAMAKQVRLKTTERDVWTKTRTVEREAWFIPAKGDRPARVYFKDGEYSPAPPEKEMTVLDSGPSMRARLGLDKNKTFEAVRQKAASVIGASDLILAAWLHQLGEDELAAQALALARQPEKQAKDDEQPRWSPAWPIFAAMVHAYMVRADEEALNHGERLLALFPKDAKAYEQLQDVVNDLKRRKKKGTFGKTPAEKFPEGFERWDAKKKIDYLIDALDEVDQRQWGQPGGVPLGYDRRVKAIIDIGDAAVPALIDTLEKDDRMTRSVHFWRDFAQSRTVLSVREAALTAAMSILRVRAFETRSTGDNFTSRGKEKAGETAKQLRAYWTKYGGKPFDERMMAVLTDKEASPEMWREAAENLARLGEQRTYSTTIELIPFAVPPKGTNPAIARFKNPTVAEAILAGLDRDLKIHDADKKDEWYDYTRREIEGKYISALVQLQDKRIAAELVKRFEHAETIRMKRQLALSAHWLGDNKAIKAFAEICREGKGKLPAKTKYTSSEDELYYVLATLADAHLPEADRALFAVVDPKHPWHKITAQAVLASRADYDRGFERGWLFHPYCLPILRRALDDTTATGATLKVESDGRVSRSSKSSWMALNMPAILRDPKVRRPESVERRCDEAAVNISFLAAGVPAYHPLLKDADERLPKLKTALDRLPQFRRATDYETAILRPYDGDEPEKSFFFDYTQQMLFVPAIGMLDHPATMEDVKAGRALFHLDGKGKLHDLHLPAYGILKKDKKTNQRERLLIIQAEVAPDGTVTYGVISRYDVRVLSGKDVEKTKSIRDWKKEEQKDNQ